MKKIIFSLLGCMIYIIGLGQLPHLVKNGAMHQLMVDGKPYLILGGELGNSTATTMENMEDVWPKMKAMHVNTLLIPVYWELIEPIEGKFEFELYENLILEARKQEIKIVFLWFGSWKNSMSSHAPRWVKLDQERFPRVKDNTGRSQDILSSFSENVLESDKKAFEALMSFIKQVDSKDNTVLMVQVENEIGMLPSARDHQTLAEAAYKKPVPSELTNYLKLNKDALLPEMQAIWKQNGFKTRGSWQEIFGEGVHTDEIFMAYYYSRFANDLAASGKKVYNLPMFVNAALNRPGRNPGDYPSAGPLPHLLDIWKAGGKALDFLSPDIYYPDFQHWADLYVRQGDPLFIPETVGGQTGAANGLFYFAKYGGLGFSPFHIEGSANPQEDPMGQLYHMMEDIKPLYLEKFAAGKVNGVLINKEDFDKVLNIGDYQFVCKHDYTLSWTPGAKTEIWPRSAAMIIQMKDNEFYIIGTGVVITFRHKVDQRINIGLLKVDEGNFEDGNWKVIRHLNGDQIHQGRHVNIPTNQFAIQRVELYTYE